MKRVLLDHCVPRRVGVALPDCDVKTAYRQGWGQLKNGALLSAAENAGFDILITADKNLRHQQNLARRQIAIIVLPTNSLQRLLPLFPNIAQAVVAATPGSYRELPSP